MLIQGVTLGPLIKALGLSKSPATDDGEHPAIAARTAAERAALAAIELRAADPLDGAMAQDLLAEFRDRAGTHHNHAAPNPAASRATHQARLALRLHANQAARTHVVALARDGELGEEELIAVVEELDLEDLRLRRQLGGAAH